MKLKMKFHETNESLCTYEKVKRGGNQRGLSDEI